MGLELKKNLRISNKSINTYTKLHVALQKIHIRHYIRFEYKDLIHCWKVQEDLISEQLGKEFYI